MNHQQDLKDLMPWEVSARDCVGRELRGARFDCVNGVVAFPAIDKERDEIRCRSIEELRNVLDEMARNDWSANVPFEGGEAVFDDNADSIVEDILEEYEPLLVHLGWQV